MAERDFKGVWIPKTVWLDNRLNALDKVILAEIDSLDQGERGCYASNKHIADFCLCSETKVATTISKLKKLGYLYVRQFDGRQRELKSCLSNFERQTFKNYKADFQILKESNTESNTDNNTVSIIMPGTADADTGPAEPAVVNLMLNDKSLYPVTQSQIDHWSELYPAVDVKQELLKMQGWLESNPNRRKTKRGINAFITSWLSREQDKGSTVQNQSFNSGQTRQSAPETDNPFLKRLMERENENDNK